MPAKGIAAGDHVVAEPAYNSDSFRLHVTATERNVSVMHIAPGHHQPSVANADHIDPGIWWVARIKVVEHSQGRGVGNALCAVMKAACAEMGAREVRVSPGGYDGNTARQRAFYERNGFVEEGEPDELRSLMVWRPRNERQ